MLSNGVTTRNGTLTVTLTKLPDLQAALLSGASVMVVHWIVMAAPGPVRPGTRFFWASMVESVSTLLPRVQDPGLHG